MKRSEALDIIDKAYTEFVEEWLQIDLNNLENFTPLKERVLSALEEAGMLPPFNKTIEPDDCLAPMFALNYSWEPEE